MITADVGRLTRYWITDI